MSCIQTFFWVSSHPFAGRNEDTDNNSFSSDKDVLRQFLCKINSIAGSNPSSHMPKSGSFDLNVSQVPESSTDDLLGVLSEALKTSGFASLSQGSTEGSADCKRKGTDENSRVQTLKSTAHPPVPKEFLEYHHSSGEESRPSLQLQLFSSPEEGSPPKIVSSSKYLSSESSYPLEDGSHSSSPPIERSLFPLKSGSEALILDRRTTGPAERAAIRGREAPLEQFNEGERRIAGQPYQAGGYVSSSGSDQSPSSSQSDVQVEVFIVDF